jgi:hypothetical protein
MLGPGSRLSDERLFVMRACRKRSSLIALPAGEEGAPVKRGSASSAIWAKVIKWRINHDPDD